jgi:predicted  nucleic acid-binding Zn-ribbon protein
MTTPDPTGSCPKCGSNALQTVQLKRSSVSKELVTEYYLRSTPSAAASADTIIQNVCTRCGCRWIPRTRQERQLRALSGQLGQEAMRAAQAEVAAEGVRAQRALRSPLARLPALTWVLVVVLAIVLLLVVVT